MSRKRKNFHDEMEPTEKLTSDGDLLVKNLVQKQLSKKTSLLEELNKRKEFQSSTQYIPISNFSSGVNILGDFRKTSEYIQELEQFKAAGLNENDMSFYMDYMLGGDYVKVKHKNLVSSTIEERLENIRSLLDKHKKQVQTCTKSVIGRHQTEFMLSVKPESAETALLKFALDNEKKEVNNLPSAMDQLKHIEQEMMTSLHSNEVPSDISEVQKRIRKKEKHIKSMNLIIEEPKSRIPKSQLVKNSKWDIKDITIEQRNTEKNYGCEKQPKNLYTIKNGEIVKLDAEPPQNVYRKYSLEEIKQIPRFAEYTPGNPSNTLYIKNLPSVQEDELRNLFKAFNFENVAVKILNGRLKGQAFIEMENSALAEQALISLNGTILKNKPMIIEFGKRMMEKKKTGS